MNKQQKVGNLYYDMNNKPLWAWNGNEKLEQFN